MECADGRFEWVEGREEKAARGKRSSVQWRGLPGSTPYLVTPPSAILLADDDLSGRNSPRKAMKIRAPH